MSIMIVSDSIKQRFADAESPIEICSSDGKVLGYFTPTKPKQYNLDPGISEEELDRREKQGGGRALSEILRDLENRK